MGFPNNESVILLLVMQEYKRLYKTRFMSVRGLAVGNCHQLCGITYIVLSGKKPIIL